jgi:outer membrane protein OmpA-like peptidoglycan-associated protein
MKNLRVSLSTLAVASLLTLAPVAARADAATDGQLAADHAAYRAQQQAIAELNASGRHPLRSHAMAKAQCWLDVSFHEYTRNDRSAFPAEALRESRRITAYLAEGGVPGAEADPSRQTPLVNGAARLREDLWTQAGALLAQPGRACAEALVACAEVELVHAGNEHKQLGWRHAKPYIQIAEDQMGAAARAAEVCPGAVAPAAAPAAAVADAPIGAAPEPAAAPAPAMTERISIDGSLLFGFNGRTLGDMPAAARGYLDRIVQRLERDYARIDQITLTGHTDRLGREPYNERLSLERAEAVQRALSERGLKASMERVGMGSKAPLVQCAQKSAVELRTCLAPNRRVELEVRGVPR